MLTDAICEKARLARDPRFDGLFFTGVLSTGIFCRPICPAPQPKARNVTYFPSAAAALAAGLRPCLRCRPESAPGTPAWKGSSATVARAMALIRQGALDDGGIEELATRLGLGGRHLRRLFTQHLGTSPIAVANAQRVLFARQMLGETDWPITRIALAAGFGSIRRFNAAFRQIFGQTPSALRGRLQRRPSLSPAGFQVTLKLAYRPPYHWPRMLDFFRQRAIPGVEWVTETGYHRTIRAPRGRGWIHVAHAAGTNALSLSVSLSDEQDLMNIVQRVRRMFDLDANMAAVSAILAADPDLAPLVARLDGLRLPGAWDPFETAVRAVVGQQISVKAAHTVLGRIAHRAGPPLTEAHPLDLNRYFPTADEMCRTELAGVGVTGRRLQTLRELTRAVVEGTVDLASHAELGAFTRKLTRLPGIGDWTAQYIAMRALGEPDAFPAGDRGLARALSRNGSKPTPAEILQMAEKWRPWRAYAATWLWNSLPQQRKE